MRFLAFALALCASFAHADLYRWVDRETGTVKFSTSPPPWYGDPERERQSPPVEVIRYRGAAAPKPPSVPEVQPAAAAAIGTLEARRAELAKVLASLPPDLDFARVGPGIHRQLEAYQTLVAELDRLDPAGAGRRRAQEPPVIEALRRGLPVRAAQ